MTAFDTSVMFGTVDRHHGNLARSRLAFEQLPKPFLTTEACLAETMHLAGSRLGWSGQDRIWNLLDSHSIEIMGINLSLTELLMSKYRDVPMDLADVTLVAVCCVHRKARVATFDSDFLAYRRDDGTPVPLVDDRLLGWS